MAREFMDFIKGEFETPFGMMEFAITEYNHVHVGAGGGSSHLPGILVRGHRYYTSIHLYRTPDGIWAKLPESPDPYMSRNVGPDASSFVQKKAYEGIREAWQEFISGDDAALIEAERGHLNNAIGDVEKEIEKAAAAMEQLQAKHQELIRQEKKIYERRAEIMKRGGYPHPRDWSPRGQVPEA